MIKRRSLLLILACFFLASNAQLAASMEQHRKTCENLFSWADQSVIRAGAPRSVEAERRNIVGIWAESGELCDDPRERISVRPMQIIGTRFRCDFSTVKRQGQIVTWNGRCSDDDSPRPVNRNVVATQIGQILNLEYRDPMSARPVVKIEGMTRCP